MGALYRFRFFCQVACCTVAVGAFCRFFRLRFAISPYYKRTYANFPKMKMANIRCNIENNTTAAREPPTVSAD